MTIARLTCIFVSLGSFSRSFYWLVDPWDRLHIIGPVLNNLIYGTIYPFLYISYFLLLVAWIEAYHAKSKIKPGRLVGKLRVFFIIVGISLFIFEFIYRVVLYYSSFNNLIYGLWVGLICLIVSGGFLIYGILIYRQLSSSNPIMSGNSFRSIIRKVTIFTMICSSIVFSAIIGYIGLNSVWNTDYPDGMVIVHLYDLTVLVSLSFLIIHTLHQNISTASTKEEHSETNVPSTRTSIELSRKDVSISVDTGIVDSKVSKEQTTQSESSSDEEDPKKEESKKEEPKKEEVESKTTEIPLDD